MTCIDKPYEVVLAVCWQGAATADSALRSAASGLSSEGSGPASWPLLGGAEAKRMAALDAARSRSGRLL